MRAQILGRSVRRGKALWKECLPDLTLTDFTIKTPLKIFKTLKWFFIFVNFDKNLNTVVIEFSENVSYAINCNGHKGLVKNGLKIYKYYSWAFLNYLDACLQMTSRYFLTPPQGFFDIPSLTNLLSKPDFVR